MTEKKPPPERLTEDDFLKMTGFCARLFGARNREIGHTWVTLSSFADNLDIPEKTIRDALRDGTIGAYAAKHGYKWDRVKVQVPQHGTTKGTTAMNALDFVKWTY